MMKHRLGHFLIAVMSLCISLSACRDRKQETDYPGFHKVHAATSSQFFIKLNLINTTGEGKGRRELTFDIIAPHADKTYERLQVMTNCSTDVFVLGGARFDLDGTIRQTIARDVRPHQLHSGSDIDKVAREACGLPEEGRVADSKPQNPNASSSSSGFDDIKEMLALFGNYDRRSRSSKVVVTDGSVKKNGRLNLILDAPYLQNGTKKHLLVTSTTIENEECHSCEAVIGGFVVALQDGQWTPEISDLQIGKFGTNGGDGLRASPLTFGQDNYGFKVKADYLFQGTESSEELLIARLGEHFQPVLEISTAKTNQGNCAPFVSAPCYGNRSRLAFLPSSHNLLDLDVIEQGTDESPQGVVSVNKIKHYVFNGSRYFENTVDTTRSSVVPTSEQAVSASQNLAKSTAIAYPTIQASDTHPKLSGSLDGSTSDIYKAGGDVSSPHLITKVEPEYSEEARAANISGVVGLSIVIDEQGVPTNIQVTRPFGHGLDESAVQAVKQWRFAPGLRNGKPVKVRANVSVSFRLLDRPR